METKLDRDLLALSKKLQSVLLEKERISPDDGDPFGWLCALHMCREVIVDNGIGVEISIKAIYPEKLKKLLGIEKVIDNPYRAMTEEEQRGWMGSKRLLIK